MNKKDSLFLEALEGLSSETRGSRTPYSEAPRKDFGPQSGSRGYHHPYQSNLDGATNLGADQTIINTPLVPWELSQIDADLADSAVYLATALDKINTALNNETTLSDKQKKSLKKYKEILIPCLQRIKAVGHNVITVINLAKDFPPLMSPNVEEN